MVTAGGR